MEKTNLIKEKINLEIPNIVTIFALRKQDRVMRKFEIEYIIIGDIQVFTYTVKCKGFSMINAIEEFVKKQKMNGVEGALSDMRHIASRMADFIEEFINSK